MLVCTAHPAWYWEHLPVACLWPPDPTEGPLMPSGSGHLRCVGHHLGSRLVTQRLQVWVRNEGGGAPSLLASELRYSSEQAARPVQ